MVLMLTVNMLSGETFTNAITRNVKVNCITTISMQIVMESFIWGTPAKMNLYNNTIYDDKVLSKVVTACGRKLGVRTKNVIVQVNPSKRLNSGGMMYHAGWVRWKKNNKNTKMTECRGAFKVTLLPPEPLIQWWDSDVISIAERFVYVLLHEWGHIKDYHNRVVYNEVKTKSGRQVEHDKRLCELAVHVPVPSVIEKVYVSGGAGYDIPK